MIRAFLPVLLFLFTLPLLAQKQISKQSSAWVGYYNQVRITDKWAVGADVQLRRTGFLDRWSMQMIRPAITYLVSENLRFTLGYGYVRNYPAAGFHTVRPENRLWQQVVWTGRYKRLQTQQWIRVEERFNHRIAHDELQKGYNFNFRFRYFLNLMVALNRDAITPNTVFAVLNDEIYINAGKQITYNMFDQNRIFIGLGYQVLKGLNVQIGYMNQFQQLPAGNQFTRNNILRAVVFHNIDFRRKPPVDLSREP